MSLRTSPPIRATYRLQFGAGFGFDRAAALAAYLESLGISHLYASPYMQTAPESTHGYAVVDPNQVSDVLGGAEAHTRMCSILQQHSLGQVLDIVPNHMAIGGRHNRWWWDILENGHSSRYADYFDVEWGGSQEWLRDKILLPVLGDQYGRVLQQGGLRIARNGADFFVQYHEHEFPLAPRSVGALLLQGSRHCDCPEMRFFGEALEALPLPNTRSRIEARQRRRHKDVLHNLLSKLLAENAEAEKSLDQAITELNADPAAVHKVLEQQTFRLAHWHMASESLQYRRFFDINTLAGLRVEDEDVFQESHETVLEWVRERAVDGLRIDHPDGLRDPESYLERLRRGAPHAWIVVEKILEQNESLPVSWPVQGTTGYDFMNLVGALFVKRESEPDFTECYYDFIGGRENYATVLARSKQRVIEELFGSDLARLLDLLRRICEQHLDHRDYTRQELRDALEALLIAFPVYRTYRRSNAAMTRAMDLEHLRTAVDAAIAARETLREPLGFIAQLLRGDLQGENENEFSLRFQQLTGPVMAKGAEDTAFYRYNRFIALNEVGGDPARFGIPLETFHQEMRRFQAHWPETMLSTSTHDTKRSEDVRARLAVLSEIPDRWRERVFRWRDRNEQHWEGHAPKRNLEYQLYQTLVGTWPITAERVLPFVQKAIREAKEFTSWTRPDTEQEGAVERFVQNVLADRAFIDELATFVDEIISAGYINALAQTLIKLTAPGVPDIYQGTEIWELSLVDPDNRRPVDFELRQKLLQELDHLGIEEIVARAEEGLPKLWLIRQCLNLRKDRPAAFGREAPYEPLYAEGESADSVVAYSRAREVVAIAPRLTMRHAGTSIPVDVSSTRAGEHRDPRRAFAIENVSASLALPSGSWRNILTGELMSGSRASLTALWSRFPVALLVRQD